MKRHFDVLPPHRRPILHRRDLFVGPTLIDVVEHHATRKAAIALAARQSPGLLYNLRMRLKKSAPAICRFATVLKRISMIHLNVVVWPVGLKAKVWRKHVGTPALETRSLHQLTISRLGVHYLLECRAFL